MSKRRYIPSHFELLYNSSGSVSYQEIKYQDGRSNWYDWLYRRKPLQLFCCNKIIGLEYCGKPIKTLRCLFWTKVFIIWLTNTSRRFWGKISRFQAFLKGDVIYSYYPFKKNNPNTWGHDIKVSWVRFIIIIIVPLHNLQQIMISWLEIYKLSFPICIKATEYILNLTLRVAKLN